MDIENISKKICADVFGGNFKNNIHLWKNDKQTTEKWLLMPDEGVNN